MANDTKATAPSKPIKTEFALATPVAFNGETFTSITYRPATGRDMRKALNIGKAGDRYHVLMVDLCELPEPFFDQMASGDYMALTDVMDGFFGRGPATSKT